MKLRPIYPNFTSKSADHSLKFPLVSQVPPLEPIPYGSSGAHDPMTGPRRAGIIGTVEESNIIIDHLRFGDHFPTQSMESLGFENYHGGFRFPKGTRLVLCPVVT